MKPIEGAYLMWPTNHLGDHLGLDDRPDDMTLVQVVQTSDTDFRIRDIFTWTVVKQPFANKWLEPSGRADARGPRAATDAEVLAGLQASVDYLEAWEQNAYGAYKNAGACKEASQRQLEHHRRKTAA